MKGRAADERAAQGFVLGCPFSGSLGAVDAHGLGGKALQLDPAGSSGARRRVRRVRLVQSAREVVTRARGISTAAARLELRVRL